MPAQFTPAIAPPAESWTALNDYDGSGNLIYYGRARSVQSILYTFTGVTVSKAAAAVVTSVAHGLTSGQAVTFSGATAGWVTINGTRTVTVLTADTFSVAIDSSGFAGNFDGTITTLAPRTNSPCWSLQQNFYNGSFQLIRTSWACSTSGGVTSPIFAWDSRTTYAYA